MREKNSNTRKELYIKYAALKSVCTYQSSKRYEGVPLDKKWQTFEGFYNDNIKRYRLAKKKWRHYKQVTPTAKNINNHIILKRRIKSKGFTRANTLFTSASDAMKLHRGARLVVFNDKQTLGTRDLKNILEKRGITKNLATIGRLHREGKDIFQPNRLDKYKWKGKYMSLDDVAKKENVNIHVLENHVYGNKETLQHAVYYAKHNYTPRRVMFEGQLLFPKAICEILSERHGIKFSTIMARYMKQNGNIDKIIYVKSTNIHAPYPKEVIAEKDGKQLKFTSIIEAAKELSISAGNISVYARGKRNGLLRGYKFTMAQ